MFLKIDSITRRTPFPNHRLLWASSPAFNRYYEGTKTASAHFLASLFARIRYPDVSQWFAYTGCETPPVYQGLGRPVALILVSFRAGKQEALPCSRETRFTSALLSDPGRTLTLAFSCFGFCSRYNNSENSIIIRPYEALSHSFCNHCLRFMQAFLLTMQDSFPAVGLLCRTGLVTCWVSSKGFNEQFIPLSRAAHGAILYPRHLKGNIRYRYNPRLV